jgi:CDP-glucose 4,6-dehydratase
MIDQEFWVGKRVFLTGHTGFKGSWLSLWLAHLGCSVKGYSLNPPTSPSLFDVVKIGTLVDSQIGDIRDQEVLNNSMVSFNPDILIHMAAQPLVRRSYDEPIETYDVNVIGTAKVLEAARNCSNLKAIINITTDKCYENVGFDKSYQETDPMGGFDPYSSSKGCAELITASYRSSFLNDLGIGVASVRAGNVIGGGDWANDRLIPDILRSFELNKPVIVRSPNATRPWQHVLEPLSGYLLLAQKLYDDHKTYSEGWNFGPTEQDARPVNWILDKMISYWPNASWSLDGNLNPHEASFLKLNISKASELLGWTPTWDLQMTLGSIIRWHKLWLSDSDMRKVCITEIDNFTKDMNKRRMI